MIITSKAGPVLGYKSNMQPDPNSWQLNVTVKDLSMTETCALRVHGETHIGGVIFQLVECLSSHRRDWSKYALWWPQQNRWLNKNRQTLDQCSVQADAVLEFIPTHRALRVQLPDLQVISLNVDYASCLFKSMKQICKSLGLRHSEEISLIRTSNPDWQRLGGSNVWLDNSAGSNNSTLNRSSLNRHGHISTELEAGHSEQYAVSPHVPVQVQLSKYCVKYKCLGDRARMNASWLDSSKSLMEQGIGEQDSVQLRFKYYSFYDLSGRQDPSRINQIYEQAKWSILSEEVEATEQELINFAALQLQIQLQTKSWLNNHSNDFESTEITIVESTKKQQQLIDDDDDVDMALSKLEKTLDKVDFSNGNSVITTTTKMNYEQVKINSDDQKDFKLEMAEELLLYKHQKLTFKKFKSFYFVLDSAGYLSYFRTKEESVNGRPLDKICLKGCEILPDVNVSQKKFGMSVKIHSVDGVTELCLRCPDERSYARWLSALKLAARNAAITEQAFSNETMSIINLLQLQQSKNVEGSNQLLDKSMSLRSGDSRMSHADNENTQANNLLPLRMVKKYKIKQLNDKILEAYSGISHLDLYEAKWQYIKVWQGLPAYGVSYFIVKMKGSKNKENIIGVSTNRMILISLEGETLKTWRFNTMKSWNVNWESKQFEVIFDEDEIVFSCVNCDAKILNEFIGAYIYLSMRSPENNGSVDDDMFFQLTEKR